MLKRIMLLVIFIFMVFGLVACGDDVNDDKKTDLEILNEVMEEITLPKEAPDIIDLITEKNGVIITWISNNQSAITIFEDKGIVTRANIDISVTLTASFTIGDETDSKDFIITIKAISAETIKITFNVTLPENTPEKAEIYIAGNFENYSSLPNWDPAGVKANRIDNTATVVIEISITEDTIIEYKWTRGSWATVESDLEGGNIEDRTLLVTVDHESLLIENEVLNWEDLPSGVVVDEPVEVKVTFNATLPANTPMEDDIYIVGNLDVIDESYPNWDSTGSEATKLTRISETEAKIEFTFETNQEITLNYKYTRGGADYVDEERDASNNMIDNRTFTLNLDELTPIINDTVIKWKDLPLETNTIEQTYTLNFTLTVPAGTEGDVYVVGNFTNWEEAPLKLTKELDGTYTLTTEVKTNLTSIEYKYTNELPWDYPEGNAEGAFIDNRTINFDPEVLIVTIDDTVLGWQNGGYQV